MYVVTPSVQSTISSDSSNDQNSLLALSEVLPFLNQKVVSHEETLLSGYINTKTLSDLRLVIEFKSPLLAKDMNYSPITPATVSKAGQAVINFGVGADPVKLGFQVGDVLTGNGFVGPGWTGLNVPTINVAAVAGTTITIEIDSSAFTGATPTTMGAFVINDFQTVILL